MKRLMALITVSGMLVAAGCAPRANFSGNIADDVTEEPVVSEAVVQVASSSASTVGSDSGSAQASGGLLNDRRIYFEYNKSVVLNSYLPTIAAHSDFLTSNPNVRVILEGHADNRGSNEYNLALGQQRADAVREVMLANGVLPAQIETISFGEEDPAVLGDNEEAWALNRRVRIRYSNE